MPWSTVARLTEVCFKLHRATYADLLRPEDLPSNDDVEGPVLQRTHQVVPQWPGLPRASPDLPTSFLRSEK